MLFAADVSQQQLVEAFLAPAVVSGTIAGFGAGLNGALALMFRPERVGVQVDSGLAAGFLVGLAPGIYSLVLAVDSIS
jgi:hypothetical protein